MLALDGVYVENDYGGLRFHRVNAPSVDELKALVHAISHRVARFLEKRGFLERDAENSYLALEPDDDDAMAQLQGHSITYRIAVGPQQGRKVFTLQTLPPDEDDSGGSDRVAKEAGFSLHAGVSTEAHQRDKLERLCRYICRPAVSEKRLAITSSGNIRYQLKTPYRDGTTHVIFEPLDFIAKLASLVPKPRTNLTRFHGVFAPNSKFRVRVTPAKRGRGRKPRQSTGESWLDKTPAERHVAMTWMQRLKRVFNIDIETCERCKGQVKIIACIEDPAVIERILSHLKGKEPSAELAMLPEGRAPPQARLFD